MMLTFFDTSMSPISFCNGAPEYICVQKGVLLAISSGEEPVPYHTVKFLELYQLVRHPGP